MVFLTIFTVAAFNDSPARPTDIEGIWQGTLKVSGIELRIVFNISLRPDGVYTATMDSPDQGAKGIPVDSVTYKDGKLRLEVKVVQGFYEGRLQADGDTIQGQWQQSGLNLPLELKRSDKPIPPPKRPQEPKKPYPYLEEEVVYENSKAKIKLAGTLTLPKQEGSFPAALLITGSGAQDRNETVMGHRPFLVLADYLTRRGIAVLRVDDRGVGGSTGDISKATSEDFAQDVLAGIEYLKSRKEINPGQIGLIGHSEGGIIAPMAAVKSSDVAFIVLMAGTGLTGEEILYLQAALIARAAGATEETIALNRKGQEQIFTIVKQESDDQIAEKKIEKKINELLAELPEEQKKAIETVLEAQKGQMKRVLSPWFRFFVTYDPKPALMKVKCPVLALNGQKDLQVPPQENLRAIEQALTAGGNKRFTIKELPDLNHLFQTARTGSPTEYSKIEETMSPTALKLIADWILKQTEKR
ncbi:MAG: hypothetical protein AMJ79_07340 [Phycisphaerae bacterium SM23_30]|nr:MAG: hypothetical protein AMJ79_07340 [Phycisphaerae bacterium SM23_30]